MSNESCEISIFDLIVLCINGLLLFVLVLEQQQEFLSNLSIKNQNFSNLKKREY